MMMFVRVTLVAGKQLTKVNFDHVVRYESAALSDSSFLYLSSGIILQVHETVEQIDYLLSGIEGVEAIAVLAPVER